jgi:hypothetical protein
VRTTPEPNGLMLDSGATSRARCNGAEAPVWCDGANLATELEGEAANDAGFIGKARRPQSRRGISSANLKVFE